MRRTMRSRGFTGGALLTLALVGCHKGSGPSSGATSEGHEQPAAQGPACGTIACAVGEVCCNASCSICTPPDGMCTQQVCEAEGVTGAPGPQGSSDAPPPGEVTPPATGAIEGSAPSNTPTCADMKCPEGTHCELVQVQCVRAPCDPVPECRPKPR
jgi:hypothetical protein